MKKILGFAVAMIFAVSVRGQEKATVSGQVFVVTRGGENIKLGDVEIAAYDFQPVAEFVKERQSQSVELHQSLVPVVTATEEGSKAGEADEERARQASHYTWDDPGYKAAREMSEKLSNLYSNARWAAIYSLSAFYYLRKLHDPVATVRTDADGKYSLSLPPGKFALAARASRKVGDLEETYSWLVSIDVARAPIALNLANVNMASGDDPSSMIHTVNSEDESVAAAGLRGLDELQRFKEEQAAKAGAAKKAAEAEEAARKATYIRQHLPEMVKQSQARALKVHPDLGVASSALNKKFVERYKVLQAEKSPRLQEPEWPEKLADECAATP